MIQQQINCEKSGKVVTVSSVSARKVKLTPYFRGGEVYEDSVLVGLDFDGEYIVNVGDTLPIKRQKFKINEIVKMKSTEGNYIGYNLIVAKLNKSSMFLFPLLNYSRPYYRWNTDFVNCFYKTEDNQEDVALYLWYKYNASVEMEEFEAKIKKHPQYIETIDVDQYHVLYKFSIPAKYGEDFNLITQGKYSYISEVAKERILDFHSASNTSPLFKILNRSASRREKMEKELGISIPKDADLHDPMYEEEECYFNKFKITESTIKGW